MNRLLKFVWLFTIITTAFTACSKDATKQFVPENKMIDITIIAGSAASRTHLENPDGTKVLWNQTGDALQVLQQIVGEGNAENALAENPTVSSDGLTADFTASFVENTTAAGFNYWAILSQNFVENNNNDLTNYKIVLPENQSPIAGTFDPKADMLISKIVPSANQLTNLSLNFHRPIAIVRLQLKGIVEGEKIQMVQFSTKDVSIIGHSYYNLQTNEMVKIGYDEKKAINLTCSDFAATGTDDIFFTALPATLKDFTVKVQTDKAHYSKEVTIKGTHPLEFKAGHKAQIRVKMTDRKPIPKFNGHQLTDLELTPLNTGDKIIIVAEKMNKNILEGHVAMADRNEGVRNYKFIEMVGEKVDIIPDGVAILDVVNHGDNTYSFFSPMDKGYISMTNKPNMSIEKDITDSNGTKWNLSIDGAGAVSIFRGTSLIKWNNYTSQFKIYKSGQSNIRIFKKG